MNKELIPIGNESSPEIQAKIIKINSEFKKLQQQTREIENPIVRAAAAGVLSALAVLALVMLKFKRSEKK